ncbi:amino acid ABC transporter permease [Pseudothioglobus sp. nBUS_23]|jgi:polar amino acid transport system permease protein|uniref:amino acid ABC transporter permease n=1 Tax=Pseudothioglobus sp. nBUS_23 TaxID=3395318 RepID=UPI003EBFA73C
MFVDTVVEDKALHKPAFLIGLSVAVLAFFFAFNFTNTIFGEFLSPVIGNPEESGLFGRFVVSFVLSVIFVLNLLAISFARLKIQILIVWFELFLLFLAFAYSFDLKLSFIQSRIGLMISKGLFTTIYISAVSIVIATAIAIVGAIAKLSNNGFAYAIASFYTSLFRGLPLLLQVYLIYKGLPQLGFMVDAIPSGIAALSLCYGAYMTEIFRAGIQSIPKGQWEASRALGFKSGLILRKIILPQSIPIIVPPTGNQFIAMLKDSSLVSVLGIWELMYLAKTLGQRDFRHMEMLLTAAMIYWGLTIILEMIQARIERKYQQKT